MLSRMRQRTSPRILVLAASGAIGLVLACMLVTLSVLGGGRSTQASAALVATATSTTTLVPSPTVAHKHAPTATAVPTRIINTATPHPLPVPANNPPPPPPPRPPTPTPSPTQVPPTPLPPTQPPTSPTPCPTGGCATAIASATATPAPPTATPGPCAPGGAPFYRTPEPTPTTDQIAAAITAASNASGIPPVLQEAIAWQESGWQINVIACDGGIGLMQLQPDTVAWLNSLYGINDDPYTLTGNADLAARYLRYYYNFYIGYLQQNAPTACGTGGCTLDTPWPGATDGATVRDIVISVYNEGATTMSKAGITNWWYVNDVLLWMSQMPW